MHRFKHGEARPGTVTVSLDRQRTTLVFHEVPALIRDNRGEACHEEAMTRQWLQNAEEAVHTGVKIDIRRHAIA
ncbi:MAG: hypothetical protein HQL76_16990 [Magnetococcales bacterium]|nr:hypothetical protein [Magnetococcales bacterium]